MVNSMKRKHDNVVKIEALLKQLLDITGRWDFDSDVPKSQKTQCKEVGEMLNELGGFHLMTEAYYHVRDRHPAASVLRVLWHGIGDWQM
jgi:hypothetical protein